jgi:hypothetical protein
VNDERAFVRWADIERAVRPLFSVWVDQPELQWARAGWEQLERKGLTRAGDEVERAVVLVRLVALAALYHAFAKAAWQEGKAELTVWAADLEIRKARLLQHLGREFDTEYPWEDERLLESAFDEVYALEYDRVLCALEDGFGGVSSMFVSLWLSPDADWSGRLDVPAGLFDETVNQSTNDKLAAFSWLDQELAAATRADRQV